MFDSRGKAIVEIEKLGLPEVFFKIWNGNGPDRFCLQYGFPEEFFLKTKQLLTANPEVEFYVPLLEFNREVVYAYDTRLHKFVEYYYGDSDADILGANYQLFIGSLFVDLGYAGLDSIVVEVSELFEFMYLHNFIEFMQSDDDLSAADSKKRFLAGLK